MDAFAVAVCKGLAMSKTNLKKSAVVGLWFGLFQALMPFIGYILGKTFKNYIDRYDHWIAFVLLALIGANMIKEAVCKDEENTSGASLAFKVMLVMSIATSIDALAVGVTFAFYLKFTEMLFAIMTIGITTFLLSGLGVKIGSVFGAKYKSKAEFIGGLILIILGIKMLLEGVGIIN